jgi:5-methylcytosine-specific restriction endonuclease McrA
MAFPESIKKDVRERAAFQCCICQEIGPEVHHIVPLEEEGADDFNNAALLCPNCTLNSEPIQKNVNLFFWNLLISI